MKLCIKDLVEQNGFTKVGLAKKLDVSRQYIYSLYDGTVKSIKIETIEKLCEIFNCTPNDLFEYTDVQIEIQNNANKQALRMKAYENELRKFIKTKEFQNTIEDLLQNVVNKNKEDDIK